MHEAGYSDAEARAIKAEVGHYEKVRQEVKLASGDYIDLKAYEPAMRHLLDTYIRADESETLSAFDDMTLVQLVVERGEAAIDSLPGGIRDKTTIELHIGPDADREAREAVVHRWYRRWLRNQLPALLAKWEPKVGVTVTDVRIKKMKTRWGSCNAEAGRIWLNLELTKKPASCLAYILMHEMVHFLERDHNDRFRELMDRLMPQWRLHRDELNRAPLAHEEWRY